MANFSKRAFQSVPCTDRLGIRIGSQSASGPDLGAELEGAPLSVRIPGGFGPRSSKKIPA